MQVVQDASLACQKLIFDQEASGSIQLDQVLDIMLLIETLLSNLHLLVTLQKSSAPGSEATALGEAAAD